jgi:L-2-hydroxyglutarate oxidase
MAYDIAVIGGGILGAATAAAFGARGRTSVVVLESEPKLAMHQTGHNSGVIHSGLYYKPGSLKARLCTSGREALYRFCSEHGVRHERCGKIVVATEEEELPRLAKLFETGTANGLHGLRKLDAEAIREHEPHAAGIAGLAVPDTGIVDFVQVTEALAEHVQERGGEVRTNARVYRVKEETGGLALETTAGVVHARYLVNCGGLQCDRIARLCGVNPPVRIVPFRGEYYEIVPEREWLVRNLIYPVPDPRFPFLGVHFTRRIHGGVEVGPNAVPAMKREGYSWVDVSVRDALATATFGGTWRLFGRYWRTALGEVYRSLSRRAFVEAAKRLVPGLTLSDVRPAGAGVRAQALEPNGNLLDDFCIVEGSRSIHVLNAPSPAATACLTIGETIAEKASAAFGDG